MVLLSTKTLLPEDDCGMLKLHSRLCGLFKMLEDITDVTYRLKLSVPANARKIHGAFHTSLLKPSHEDQFQRYLEPSSSIRLADGSEEYEIDSITTKKKKRKGETMYLIRWKGCSNHENTWKTTEDLSNAKQGQHDLNASRRCSSW